MSTSRTCVVYLSVALLGCAAGERLSTVSPGAGEPPPGDSAGVVRRGTLVVRSSIEPPDAAIGAALGLSAVAPAGLQVTIVRSTSATEPPRVAVTDAAGLVRFDGLLEGAYQVAVERTVRDDERAALPVDARDVTGLAGGASVIVRPGENELRISAVAGRRGSLVISEIFPYRARTPSSVYSDGVYLELYNNSDTTVFVDGMLLGAVPTINYNQGTGPPFRDFCGEYAFVRRDSSALAMRVLYQFPGGGLDYPVPPGGTVLVAQDAIDHRQFAPGTHDLSRASFETLGDTRDVDNPSVPNMIRLRQQHGLGPFGRGWMFGQYLPDGYVLARRPSAPLERRDIDDGWSSWGTDIPLVPRADVLDVAMLQYNAESVNLLALFGFSIRFCDADWHPVWDRGAARIVNQNDFVQPVSFARRIAFTRPDGRVVLQRTRTSARDWVYGAPATPGFVR